VANDVATVWRIFSLEDGTTSMEQVAVPLEESRNGTLSKLLAGSGVMIRRSTAGRFAPWHPAPRRQMIVTLSGWGEMETGDGQKVRCTPGVLAVVEDVTGVGHQTWTDPAEGWYMLFIPLDDATTLT
jgi:quercetin dioxygenase-like cupin family protein